MSIISYNKAVRECTRTKEWTRSVSLLDELNCRGLQADVITYNSASAVACSSGEAWRVALLVLRCATSCWVRQDVKTYSSSVTACGKARWQSALCLASQIHVTGLRLDSIAATSAINALERKANWQQAILQLLDSRRANWQPSAFAGNAVLRATSTCQWNRTMHCVLTTLQARAISGDIITYNSMIETASDWKQAISLLQDIGDQELRPDLVTWNSLIAVCSRVVQWQRALALLDILNDVIKADLVSCNSTLAACARSGKFQQALSLLDRMLQQGIQSDVITRSALMRSCARASAWRMTLFLSSARQANMNAIALNEVQLACERACEWQLALQHFEEAEHDFSQYVTIYIYIYMYVYIYIYGTPPKIYVFYLISAISTHEHLLMTILPLPIVSS